MMTEMCKEMLDLKRKNKIKLKECFPLLKQTSTTSTTTSTTALLSTATTGTTANTTGTNTSSSVLDPTVNVNGAAAEGAVVAAPIDVDDLNFFSNEAWFSDIFLGRA